MKVITFLLHTQQPILATSFQGDPNSDVSYPYIPGSMIRGILIGRYIQCNRELPEDIVSDETVERLFFDGSTRYLNAYLFSDKEKKRTLPVPRSWYKQKGDELPKPDETRYMPVYDLSRIDPNRLPSELSSPKVLSERFCTVAGRSVVLYSEKRRLNIHNMRERKKGRSVPIKRDRETNQIIEEGEGEIFRYEALDVGQAFQAVILCKDPTDVDTIQNLLQPTDLWLGGSQSAGYGHVKVLEIQSLDTWDEVNIKPKDRASRQDLTITLLSDTILRNEEGQHIADTQLVKQAIEEKIAEKLNVNLQLPKASGIYVSSTLIGGFNRKWGLPLPQVPALAAGSVFVFNDIKLTPEQISVLEVEGIGERRVEGFGRVALNWLEKAQEFRARSAEPARSPAQPQLDEEFHDLAAQMAEKILRQKLEQLLIDRVSGVSLQGDISNSQLSRLQIVARQGLATRSRLPVFRLLRYLPSNGRNQFKRTKVSGKPFDQQIYEWLRKPESWVVNPQQLEVNIAGVTRVLSHRLAREYTLRLIMAVAKKATKEKNK